MLGAQDVPPIYLNFALPGYLSLYPEADYNNPAVILQLDRPVLLNSVYSSGYAEFHAHDAHRRVRRYRRV